MMGILQIKFAKRKHINGGTDFSFFLMNKIILLNISQVQGEQMHIIGNMKYLIIP